MLTIFPGDIRGPGDIVRAVLFQVQPHFCNVANEDEFPDLVRLETEKVLAGETVGIINAVVMKYAAHGSATDMWLWLAISALNLAALVRDYRKMKS